MRDFSQVSFARVDAKFIGLVDGAMSFAKRQIKVLYSGIKRDQENVLNANQFII